MKTTLTICFPSISAFLWHFVQSIVPKRQRAFPHVGPHFYSANVNEIPGTNCIWDQHTALCHSSYQVFLIALSLLSKATSSCGKSSGIQLSWESQCTLQELHTPILKGKKQTVG